MSIESQMKEEMLRVLYDLRDKHSTPLLDISVNAGIGDTGYLWFRTSLNQFNDLIRKEYPGNIVPAEAVRCAAEAATASFEHWLKRRNGRT